MFSYGGGFKTLFYKLSVLMKRTKNKNKLILDIDDQNIMYAYASKDMHVAY